MSNITIFGVEYPLEEANTVEFKDWLPDFFAKQKSFTAEDYYNEMVKNHPEYKKKWYESKPSEQEIQKYFMETWGTGHLDGATSVPKAEEKLGIEIGGKYNYPDGMSDIEYHAKRTLELGFYSPFTKQRELSEKEAYMEAWQNLHYNKDEIPQILERQYNEIVELNPKLAEIKLDKSNPEHLTYLMAGTIYDYPVADIQLFIDGKRIRTERGRMETELSEIGLDAKDFNWTLASETIKDIGQKMQAKELDENSAETTTQETTLSDRKSTVSPQNSAQPSVSSPTEGQFQVASVEQDLAAMSKEIGTVGFSYDDIHNSGVNTAMHNDYRKVINGVAKAQEILPIEAERKLLECGALTPLPNGEYMINVGYSTRNGGGRNHKGVVFFTASDEDVHSQYHEMAHSYQKKGNLFNDDQLDQLYAASENGLNAGENKEDKLVNRETYKDYLRETHSEIFAQASLMLREESNFGFVNQALYAQEYGDSRNAEGLLSAAVLDEGSAEKAKLYACKPAMDAAVKEIAAIRKSGKRAEYFNSDGTLNAEKLSKLCEKITLDNAYSPRTYKAFLDNNFNDSRTDKEKDWKKGTLIALAKYLPAKISTGVQDIGKNIRKKISGIKHNWLRRKDKSALQKMTAKRKRSDNPQIQAANDYAFIQAKMLLVAMSSGYQNADDIIDTKLAEMNKNSMSATDLQKMAEDIKAPKALKDLKEVYSIISENKDNPYFQAIMENPAYFADMRYGKAKLNDQTNEDTPEISLSDKEKLSVLSGRTAKKSPQHTTLETEISPQPVFQTEIAQPQPDLTQVSPTPQIDMTNMSDKEKIETLRIREKTKSPAPTRHDYKALMQGGANAEHQTSMVQQKTSRSK